METEAEKASNVKGTAEATDPRFTGIEPAEPVYTQSHL